MKTDHFAERTNREAHLLAREKGIGMASKTTDRVRELAHRASEGIDVSLYWNERTNRVTVRVYDARSDEGFELEVDGRRALDVYRHPFGSVEQRDKTIAATGKEAA
jgi:hypothetical protein